MQQLVDQFMWNNSVECGAVIYKQHTHIIHLLFKVAKCSVHGTDNGVFSGPV